MIIVNKGTKIAETMLWQWRNCNRGEIEKAYSNPSDDKRSAYKDIWFRAKNTEGYNNDLKVVARNSYIFCTMYSYTDDKGTVLVKDTPSNTYCLRLE